jgi:hypothetical protein
MSQVIIDVFNIASSTVGADPVAGSWSSSAIPASSDVTVHKVGKCVLAGENLYVPVYLDGKGSWAATSTFSVTTRDDHDVVILKFRVSNAGEVILDSTYQALPKPPADSSDWLHELAIAGSEGKLLGLSTQSVGAFAMELRAGLVVEQTTKKGTRRISRTYKAIIPVNLPVFILSLDSDRQLQGPRDLPVFASPRATHGHVHPLYLCRW